MPEEESKTPEPLDIVSFLVLLLAASLFFYIAFYRTAEQNRRHINSLTKKADAEIKAVSDANLAKIKESNIQQKQGKQKEQVKQKDSKPKKELIVGVPTFLQTINKEITSSGTELRDVKKLDNYTYTLTVSAPFYRLVNFLYRIEQFNLAIQNMTIQPTSTHNNSINLTLKITGNEMSKNNLEILDAFQKKYAKTTRDPFQKDTSAQETAGPSDVIDLTWEFKLTGTGFDKAKYAHIDRKNYYEGDIFKRMRIVGIHKDRVDLELGSQKYFIGFRKRVRKR